MLRALLLLAVLALACVSVRADNYAVLVAGSNTYANYRHQADVCHAYKLLRKYGIPEANIITFLFDDVAFDAANPFPGRLFNRPTDNKTRGVDVYVGCGGAIEANIYRGADVVPDVFIAVITGNVTGVPAGKAVLTSTQKDDVFINFVDHGGPGTIYFPGFIPFQAATLNAGLQTMYEKKMYNQLVFYLEACEAGSIFDKQLSNATNIYAVTASNTDESSWGTYCPGEENTNGGAMVDGVDVDSCLGDLFSVNWMEDSDRVGVKELLSTQFTTVRNLTTLSHVMQYGQTDFTDLPTGTFIGGVARSLRRLVHNVDTAASAPIAHKTSVPSRDVPMHLLYNRYKKATTSAARRSAMRQLAAQVEMRTRVDSVFERFAELAVQAAGDAAEAQEALFDMPDVPIVHTACMNEVEAVWRGEECVGGWNEYSTQYGAVIINACRMLDNGALLGMSMRAACSA